ncbi:MAG: hypothetical protein ACJASI_001572 [Glaciecola sp.]|jgi:hypothetical protein
MRLLFDKMSIVGIDFIIKLSETIALTKWMRLSWTLVSLRIKRQILPVATSLYR